MVDFHFSPVFMKLSKSRVLLHVTPPPPQSGENT